MEEMQKTKKRYDENPYEMEFTAEVISCREDQDGYWVILDQTCFFPNEGGQTPDRGFLGNKKVLDVQIKEEVIEHKIDGPLTVGEQVEGQVDFKERFSNMQQHTAEHIISGLLYRTFGLENVGFHLSQKTVTLDVNGVLTEEEVKELFWCANRIIWEDVEVKTEYPAQEALEELSYRSKKEIDGPVRIVTIGNYDTCACCAPHVARTGEIGLVKLLRLESYKGGMRLTIAAGSRALEDSLNKENVLTEVCRDYSANPDTLLTNLEKAREEAAQVREKMTLLTDQLVELLVRQTNPGSEPLVLFVEELDSMGMKKLMNRLKEICTGMVSLFSGEEGNYRFLLTGGCKNDSRELMKSLEEAGILKGGGNAAQVQGTIQAGKDTIKKILK